jgi:hypothetical protein
MRAGLPQLSTTAVAAFRSRSPRRRTPAAEPDAPRTPALSRQSVHVQTKVFLALQAAPCVKSDGWQTTAV